MIKKQISIYDFKDYRKYLETVFYGQRGGKSQFANSIGCSGAFVARVLGGLAQLSPEQALAASKFLGHLAEEGEYFLTLVQWDRAGTPELRDFYREKLDGILAKRALIQERIGKGVDLDLKIQSMYYSSWIYAAAHVLANLAESPRDLALKLNLPLERLKPYLNFLIDSGLVVEENGKLRSRRLGLHLSKNSPMIRSHHGNWRMKALESLNCESSEDIHFSGVYVLSEKTLKLLQIRMADFIEEIDETIAPSPSECGVAFNLDFYRMG